MNKKILYSFLLGFLTFIGFSFADCIIYGPSNELLMMYACEEGTTEIILDGDWSKVGNNYKFNGGFAGLDVYYFDGYGESRKITTYNDLYLNGNLTLGYTGEQYLTFSDGDCGTFNGYIPNFEVVFSGSTLQDTGNVFNNFAENSLKFTLSNIPSYIQYVIIIMLLFFVLGIIRKFKRR